MSKVDASVLKILFPGTEVVLHSDPKVSVVVYPAGIIHLRKFNQAIEEVIPKIATQIDIRRISIQELTPMVFPILIGDLLDLINDCTIGIDLTQNDPPIPHHWLPRIIDAWIQETFGTEEKIRPWIEVLDKAIERATGQNPGIWETLSKSLSRAAMTSGISSPDKGSDVPTSDGLSQS